MIPLETNDIESDLGGLQTQKFEIAESGEAWDILGNDVYKDKIQSPQREYMTNAADAHIAAGHMKDFEVQLPTALEPTFRVRDFGPGIDPDDVIPVFCKAFASTKTKTNTQTGHKGLGSKSVHCYADNFDLRIWQKGVQRTYFGAKDDEGIPILALTDTRESDEPDGLEISWAVESQDINAYTVAAAKVKAGFKGYPIQPRFNIEVPDYLGTPLLEGNNWAVYSSDTTRRLGQARTYLRQGPVLYPVDHIQLVASNVLTIIDVPMGSVSIAASRESLSLNRKTTNYIENLFEEIRKDIADSISDSLSDCTSYFDACEKYFGGLQGIQNLPDIEWRGKKLQQTIDIPLDELEGVLASEPRDGSQGFGYRYDKTHNRIRVYTYGDGRSNIRFIYKKKGVDVDNRVNRWYRSQVNYGLIYYYLHDVTDKDIQLLKDTLQIGDHQFIDIASVAYTPLSPYVAPKRKREYKPARKVSAFESVPTGNRYYDRTKWEPVDLPADGNYYWIEADRKLAKPRFFPHIHRNERESYYSSGTPMYNLEWLCFDLQEWRKIMVALGMPDKPIYVIPDSDAKVLKPPASKKYVTVLQKFLKKKEKLIIDVMAMEELSRTAFFKSSKHRNSLTSDQCAMLKHIISDSQVQLEKDGLSYATAVSAKRKEYAERYPLLFGYGKAEDIDDYIKFVDKQNKRKAKV